MKLWQQSGCIISLISLDGDNFNTWINQRNQWHYCINWYLLVSGRGRDVNLLSSRNPPPPKKKKYWILVHVVIVVVNRVLVVSRTEILILKLLFYIYILLYFRIVYSFKSVTVHVVSGLKIFDLFNFCLPKKYRTANRKFELKSSLILCKYITVSNMFPVALLYFWCIL